MYATMSKKRMQKVILALYTFWLPYKEEKKTYNAQLWYTIVVVLKILT